MELALRPQCDRKAAGGYRLSESRGEGRPEDNDRSLGSSAIGAVNRIGNVTQRRT
jgi:hypothetical protein